MDTCCKMFKMYWFLFFNFLKYCHFISTTFWASCKLYYHLFSQQALLCRRTVALRSRPRWRWWRRRLDWPTALPFRRCLHQQWRFPRWRVGGMEPEHTSSNREIWTSWRPPASENASCLTHRHHRSHEMMTSSCLVQCIPVLLVFFF